MAERASLERTYTRKGIVGSNPTLSAPISYDRSATINKETVLASAPFRNFIVVCPLGVS